MDWVDPRMAALLSQSAASPAVDLMTLPINEARAAYEQKWKPWNANPRAMHEVRDFLIKGKHAPIRTRLYCPDAAARGTILFLHGGGWMFGSIESHDALVRELAFAANATLVSIEYRRSPEHPYPTAIEDTLEAVAFIMAGEVDGASAPIAVAGDSAGAAIALSALLRLKATPTKISAAALFYGCYDLDFETTSYQTLGDGRFGLSLIRMQTFWRNYLGGNDGSPSDDAVPARGNLAGLPPIFLHAAGLDVLMSDSLNLAERLHREKVPFELSLAPGLVHGHLQMVSKLEPSRPILQSAGRFLQRALGGAAAG
ncbi:MAG TPA: alpha/beta hydrolase [Rhizobiaceae bacterium]|nr:alpha/beta hydrolase [Rhizobiaceae bacterium]